MSKIPADVQQAISDSTGRNEIVTLEFSEERAAALLDVCDDWTEGNGVIEYWADADDQGDDAMAWRVHLAREAHD